MTTSHGRHVCARCIHLFGVTPNPTEHFAQVQCFFFTCAVVSAPASLAAVIAMAGRAVFSWQFAAPAARVPPSVILELDGRTIRIGAVDYALNIAWLRATRVRPPLVPRALWICCQHKRCGYTTCACCVHQGCVSRNGSRLAR